MASNFGRWEKDPFFTAAEEVQESTDRMESTYRTWIHAKKDSSTAWNVDEIQRDLHTAFGTAKWQLEEFERAVRSSYGTSSSDDARNRHLDFITAIEDKIKKTEHSLQELAHLDGKASPPWVHLDEGDINELALFLTGMPGGEVKNTVKSNSSDSESPQLSYKDSACGVSKNFLVSSGWNSLEAKEEQSAGHHRTAIANADIGSWKIAVSDDIQQGSASNWSSALMHKMPSFSRLLSSMESVFQLKWSKNGFRKLKATDHHLEADNAVMPSAEWNRGIKAWCEKSNSCPDSCDECYDKQLYGWYGAIQRQLRRPQCQMQHRQPVQITVWLLLCMIVLVAFRAM